MAKIIDRNRKLIEQRAEERYACVGSVALYCTLDADSINGTPPMYRAPLQDMSLSGLAFDVASPLQAGQKLMVLIQQPGGMHERLMTEVRWCKPMGVGAFRIGVRIDSSEMLMAADAARAPESATPAGSIIGVLTSYRQVMADSAD